MNNWGIWDKIQLGLLLSLPFVEAAVNVVVVKSFGAVVTYSLYAVPTLIGLALQWRYWHKRIKPLQEEMKIIAKRKKNSYKSRAYQNRARLYYNFWMSVILLLIPGFVTDIFALGLMLSSVSAEKQEAPIVSEPGNTSVQDKPIIACRKYFRSTILVCFSFFEFALTVLLVGSLGATTSTFLMFAIPTTLGLAIQWFRWPDAKAAWEVVGEKAHQVKDNKELAEMPDYIDAASRLHCFWLSIILFVIPGLLSDIVAFGLMLPSIRKRVNASMQRSASTKK